MYEVTCIDKDGKRFTKEFVSEFFYRKFLEKAKRSKELTVVSHGRKF